MLVFGGVTDAYTILKNSTWTCSFEKKHLLDKQTVFGGFKGQIPVPPPNHQLWNGAHYDYRKMRSDQPMPKWTVNLKRDFQQLDHETNNKVHRGVLLYEMLFATTPFTGRCNFSGWWIFGGKAPLQSFLEGSDPLFVCKGSCLIRYPKWQWTSWKLEDYRSFPHVRSITRRNSQAEDKLVFQLFECYHHPQLHKNQWEDHLVATCLPCYLLWYLPSKWNQQWDKKSIGWSTCLFMALPEMFQNIQTLNQCMAYCPTFGWFRG